VRLRRRSGTATPPPSLQPLKLEMIAEAARAAGARSFADLGGVWAVDGGYSFAALDQPGMERGTLVDDDLSPALRERAASEPRLRLVERNFGDADVPDVVGDVDLVLLFDVLLHQVDPDWDAMLARWAPRAQAMAIVQPQWTGSDATVRLIDLGRDAYLAAVPPDPLHDALFDRLDEPHPRRGGRAWRDVHDVWQWGITDADLVARMADLGFAVAAHADRGPWRGLEQFSEVGFAFARTNAGDRAS
jgi:hypothetical protein